MDAPSPDTATDRAADATDTVTAPTHVSPASPAAANQTASNAATDTVTGSFSSVVTRKSLTGMGCVVPCAGLPDKSVTEPGRSRTPAAVSADAVDSRVSDRRRVGENTPSTGSGDTADTSTSPTMDPVASTKLRVGSRTGMVSENVTNRVLVDNHATPSAGAPLSRRTNKGGTGVSSTRALPDKSTTDPAATMSATDATAAVRR